MSKFKISKANIEFNYDHILRDFLVVRFTASKKWIQYDASYLDEIKHKHQALSIVYEQSNCFYALYGKNESKINISNVLESLDGTEDLRYEHIKDIKTLKEVPKHLLGQLLINSISTPKHKKLAFNNITGKLISINFDQKLKKTKQVVGIEFKLNASLHVELNVRTFTSVLLKNKMNFKKKKFHQYAQYTLVFASKTLRRVHKGERLPLEELYILKSPGIVGSSKKNNIPFLNFQSLEEFENSKIGVLNDILRRVEEKLKQYIVISMTEATPLNTIRYCRTEFLKKGHFKFNLVDTLSTAASSELISNIEMRILALSKNFEISREVEKNQQQLKLIHNKEYYQRTLEKDPYHPSFEIQHISMEDFGHKVKDATMAAMYNLAIKNDIKNRRVSMVNWGQYEFKNPWIFGIKVNDEYWYLTIDQRGLMRFDTVEFNLFQQDEYAQLQTIFDNPEVEFVVKDDKGNVNYISRTNGFSIPEYETIYDTLYQMDRPIKITKEESIEIVSELFDKGKRLEYIERISTVESWNKRSLLESINHRNDRKKFVLEVQDRTGEILNAYLKGESARNEILNSQLDIHHYSLNGEHFYLVGTKGKGIQSSMPRACKIRSIGACDNSELIFDKLLPLMNVDFVKNENLTVIPFPFKYLREWIAVKSVLIK